jgi:ribonucleoside-diphosphate reductase alpha chain
LAVQAEAQRWVDSAISKTINVPSDMPFEKFRDIYSRAYDLGLKGVTTFRYDPAVHQGVLVEEADSKRTKYRFRRKDGRVEEFSGNEIVDVGGEKVTAANLFDGLKELGVSINDAI